MIMDRETLKQLSAWMGFVGIMTIIGGALSALAGLFAFVIGAIPGVIAIVLGVKLRNAKANADTMIAELSDAVDTTQFNLFAANLNTYFKIQGILIIVSLALGLISFIIAFVLGVTSFLYMN
jgi:hypothetical protein